MSSKFRVYRFFSVQLNFPQHLLCSCFQPEEILLVVLHVLPMLRYKGTKTGKTKFTENCKFVNPKCRVYFVSPIRKDARALTKEIQDLTEKERGVADPLHRDYCRLQLIYCKALYLAKKAEYDIVEFKKENSEKQV